MSTYSGIDVLLTAVKSFEFQSMFSIASGYSMFMRIMQDSEIINKLIDAVRDNDTRLSVVVDALQALLDKDIDPRYQHPDDTAIACLLYALVQTDNLRALLMSAKVIETKNLFWAYKIAEPQL
jgi:hypothetical protein